MKVQTSANNRDSFDRLLSEFGASIGIPDLSFDNEGVCRLAVDQENLITVLKEAGSQRLILLSRLAEGIPDTVKIEWVKSVLTTALNPLKGDLPGIGLEPNTNTLVLYHSLPLATLDLNSLQNALYHFIQYITTWGSTEIGTHSPASQHSAMNYEILRKR